MATRKKKLGKKRVSRRAKRGTHSSPKCLTAMRYRSSWELKYAALMDADPNVESYRYEPYPIPYVSNVRTGKVRRYWPDFEVTRVDGVKLIVEVKPKKRISNPRNVKKMLAAKLFAEQRGMTYVYVTEDDLRAANIVA